jgi:hypothetical protein
VSLEVGDPAFVHLSYGDGVEVVEALAPLSAGDDEVGLFEHGEVLHDGEAGEFGEGGVEVGGGEGAFAEHVEDLASPGAGEGFEDGLEGVGLQDVIDLSHIKAGCKGERKEKTPPLGQGRRFRVVQMAVRAALQRGAPRKRGSK